MGGGPQNKHNFPQPAPCNCGYRFRYQWNWREAYFWQGRVSPLLEINNPTITRVSFSIPIFERITHIIFRNQSSYSHAGIVFDTRISKEKTSSPFIIYPSATRVSFSIPTFERITHIIFRNQSPLQPHGYRFRYPYLRR